MQTRHRHEHSDSSHEPALDHEGVTAFGSEEFRHVLGHFGSGLTIVTSLAHQHGDPAGAEPIGFTCQSFSSLSLDPPLVMFCASRASTTWPRIEESGQFCVNLLSAENRELSQSFALSGTDRFHGVDWRPAPGSGLPVLPHVLGWIDCALRESFAEGDHYVVVGQVRDLDVDSSLSPLVFFRGRYSGLAPTQGEPVAVGAHR